MLEAILYVVFVIVSVLLILIVLVQEGKGGGLTDAFGGAGVETFGVRPGGINKFTFALFAVFVMCALGIHWMNLNPEKGSVMQNVQPLNTQGATTTAPPQPGNPAPPGPNR